MEKKIIKITTTGAPVIKSEWDADRYMPVWKGSSDHNGFGIVDLLNNRIVYNYSGNCSWEYGYETVSNETVEDADTGADADADTDNETTERDDCLITLVNKEDGTAYVYKTSHYWVHCMSELDTVIVIMDDSVDAVVHEANN